MTSPGRNDPRLVALLDTTIQVDRKKTGGRQRQIDDVLKQFPWKVATGIGLLEFKATLIQVCITIHDEMRRNGRFMEVRDSLIERNHRQRALRAHVFNNLLDVFAGGLTGTSSFEVTEKEDRRLGEKARLRLESIIPRLYDWFVRDSVDAVLWDRVVCTRAKERPKKKGVAFGVNLPWCRRGNTKFCRIEEFIRSRAAPLVTQLREIVESMDENTGKQLRAACDLFESVLRDPDKELDRSDCRRAGDCLIALEGRDVATHALSTNTTEWGPLSELLGYEFVKVDYPEERRR